MKYKTIYPCGSFTGWRDQVLDDLADFDFLDPRDHRQTAIAQFVEDDMSVVQKADITLGHNLGTMSYAELGGARAAGKCILIVDEQNNQDLRRLYKNIATGIFPDIDDAVEYIRTQNPESKFPAVQNTPRDKCKNVLFLGSTNSAQNIQEQATNKKLCMNYNTGALQEFANEIDLTVVDFERGIRPKESIFYMGLSYALDIPVILSTENPIIYPPLAGLARRIFTGENRHDILGDYLQNLDSQDINQEAQVMYELFKKYHS